MIDFKTYTSDVRPWFLSNGGLLLGKWSRRSQPEVPPLGARARQIVRENDHLACHNSIFSVAYAGFLIFSISKVASPLFAEVCRAAPHTRARVCLPARKMIDCQVIFNPVSFGAAKVRERSLRGVCWGIVPAALCAWRGPLREPQASIFSMSSSTCDDQEINSTYFRSHGGVGETAARGPMKRGPLANKRDISQMRDPIPKERHAIRGDRGMSSTSCRLGKTST